MREPVNAITYGSSYKDSGIKGADYGLWANSMRLDESNFYDTVMQDNDHVWVIAFMDPTCRNCQRFVA